MNRVTQLADHFESIYRSGGWTEVGIRSVFESFSAREAAGHPIPGRHSAWELLLHIDAWNRAVTRRLSGEAVSLSPEEDWPTLPVPTDQNWQAALTTLDEGVQELLDRVRLLSEDALLEQLPENPYTAGDTVRGLAEHDLYHTGQAALLLAVQAELGQE